MSEVHSTHPGKYLSGHRRGCRLLGRLLTGRHGGRRRDPRLRRRLRRRSRRLRRRRRRGRTPSGHGQRLARARSHVPGHVGRGRRGVVGGCRRGGARHGALGRRTGRARSTRGSLRRRSVVHVQIVMAFGARFAAAVAAAARVRVGRVVPGRVAAVRARSVAAVLPLCRLLRLVPWLAPARVRHLVAVAERERVHEVGAHSAS